MSKMIQIRDASYLALAEVLDAPLVTCDRRLASVPEQAAIVEWD
jgi:predicted nucleic acid-binding protein